MSLPIKASSILLSGQLLTASGNFLFVNGVLISGGGSSTNTGELTGAFYPLYQNPSGYITGNQLLGLPTDGSYGGPNGAIAGVSQGDRGEDAFDKIEVILGKLAPSKPANLSVASWNFTNTLYAALMQGTATNFTGIMNSSFPTGRATGFYDGDAGTLSGYINGNLTGLRVLTTGIDTGNFTGLNITGDFDFWSGVAGRAGFWAALSANVCPTGALNSGQFTMQMGHSTAGSTAILTGYCNNVQTPVATILDVITGNPLTRIVDGVPSMGVGGIISGQVSMTNVISAFYAPGMGTFSSSQTSPSLVPTATGTPTSGTTMRLSGSVTVAASQFITGWTASATARNASSGVSSTATSGTNIRIDTVSTQFSERRRAGSGRYPSIYGMTYDDNHLLTNNEELQMINGSVQYPALINYTNIRPSGPNYLTINTGSFITGGSGYRWSCFNMGTISSDSSITLGFTASNFGSSAIANGLFLHVKVSGSTPTAGWVDANAAYPGVGSPTNDGDPALVVASSSSTSKVVTFGSTVRDGTVWVRLGLPSGSNKSFSAISMS